MAYKAEKTEHAGSKRGRGAYFGGKTDAKKESNKARRVADRKIVLVQTECAEEPKKSRP